MIMEKLTKSLLQKKIVPFIYPNYPTIICHIQGNMPGYLLEDSWKAPLFSRKTANIISSVPVAPVGTLTQPVRQLPITYLAPGPNWETHALVPTLRLLFIHKAHTFYLLKERKTRLFLWLTNGRQ